MQRDAPSSPLAPLVRSIWSLAGTAEEATLPGIVAPDAHVEFVFHLADTWRMQRTRTTDWLLQPSAFVYAQQCGGIRFQPTGPVSLMAFRVTPVVACQILRFPVAELWDAPIDLRLLIGEDASRLLERLQQATPGTRFKILRTWIVRRLSGWGADDWSAHGLFNAVLWRARTGSIEQVARTLGPSSRSLRRILETRAGVAPKAVQLSGRLLAACSELRGRTDLDITDIANRVGFYDHAAFTHSFAARVGLTPSQFRAEPHVFYERE